MTAGSSKVLFSGRKLSHSSPKTENAHGIGYPGKYSSTGQQSTDLRRVLQRRLCNLSLPELNKYLEAWRRCGTQSDAEGRLAGWQQQVAGSGACYESELQGQEQ